MTGRSVAVITGAARGIGAASAVALAARGWNLVLVDLDDPMSDADLAGLGYRLSNAEELAATAASMAEAHDVEAVPAPADVRSVDSLEAVVEEAIERFGRIDAAIAVAGVMAGGTESWRLDAAAEQTVVDVNLGGVMNLARVCVPHLLARPVPRRGRFIAVSSAAATRGLPMLAAYGAAKAGVEGFVRGLAAELGDSGVTANAVSPGSTDTALLVRSAELYGLADPSPLAEHQTQRRLLDPAEVASVVAFLADPASSAVTGRVISADGGLSL